MLKPYDGKGFKGVIFTNRSLVIILDNIFRINKLKEVGKRGYGTKTKEKVVFVGFRISIFIIGVIAYMDRSNISYIAHK